MSGAPVSFDSSHPPHGHPTNTSPSTQPSDKPSTSSHPPSTSPDPTLTSNASSEKEQQQQQQQQPPKDAPPSSLSGRHASLPATTTSELSSLTTRLRSALGKYPDFPKKGILFEDFLPIFADPALHESLIHALELHVSSAYGGERPDVIVGLEARGFLFGPSLALRLGCGFVPVRKEGKLPGETVTAAYEKEYGTDFFQMQKGGVKEGSKVVIVDDLIATGGSAAAAGELVKKLGGNLLGYIFIIELDFLKGRDKLDAPVHALLSSQ